VSGKKVGLALSSGAARGWAHVGVLSVLEEEGIPIDMIAGTSAGAVIGALYAQGKDIPQLKRLAVKTGRTKMAFLADLTLPKTGLFEGKRIKSWLKSIIGDVEFKDLKIPFACVATDIMTGEEVVSREGSVIDAVRASISIPVVFTPAKCSERYLVDGGLVNPVPVNIIKDMGADFIIAVNVVPNMLDRVRGVNKTPIEDFKKPNLFSIIMRTIYVASHQIVEASLEGADVVINPDVGRVGFGDVSRAQECILKGEAAARTAIDEIKRQLSA